MKQIYLLALTFLFISINLNAQNEESPLVPRCGSSDVMKAFFEEHPDQERAWKDFNDKEIPIDIRGGGCEPHYVIPVVFHVFEDGGAAEVTAAQIQSGLDRANADFAGLNDDYTTVDPAFQGIRGTLNVTFVLAEKDPNGNSTTGINYYGTLSGFANGSGYDNQVSSYAWDNYKYMNIYLMNDLYGNGATNNSGVAWYPDTWMSNNDLARVVYNHWYLGNTGSSIADGEFQSVITHEFGHWLNLIHTFENGCSNGDLVNDTPSTEGSAGCGPNAMSCGHITNGENYMDYNATCYKMFTLGQIARATDALENHPARFPLWKRSNLEATGVINYYQYADPTPDFIASSTNVMVGETVSLTDLTCGFPDTWSWTIEGGMPSTSNQQNPTTVFNTAGVYTVTLVVGDGSSSMSYSIDITVEGVMTNVDNDLIETKELEVYYQKDELFVNSSNFSIYNMIGQEILNYSNQTHSVDVSSLPSGVYIVVSDEGDVTGAKKVFIP